MDLFGLIGKALELGLIPALALFLVISLHYQNRQLVEDRRKTESLLLKMLIDMATENRNTITALYEKIEARTGNNEN